MTNARKARERRRETYQLPDSQALNRHSEAVDKPGQHVWVVTAAWQVTDPEKAYRASRTAQFDADNSILLDRENIIAFAGPGCFKCEREYSPELAGRPCTTIS